MKISNKFLNPARFFVILALLTAGYASEARAANKIIAIVNRDTITQKELDDFLAFMYIQFAREAGEEEAQKKVEGMKSDLLGKLIEDKLILQEAKKGKIEVDSSRIKARIAQIKKEYPSDVAFQADLLKQGLSQADIENKIREQLLTLAVIERKIRSRIVVRPEEVTAFYEENKAKFLSPEIREMEAYIFNNKIDATLFSYNSRLGKKIEELAARYPFVLQVLKTSSSDELKNEIRQVVSGLSYAEFSEAVKIDDKYYVFRLAAITPPKQESLFDVQDRIYAYLFETKMQKELAKWLGELKEQSYIKILKN